MPYYAPSQTYSRLIWLLLLAWNPDYSIITFEAKEQDGDVYLLLPPEEALDDAIGTSKWMVKQATADVYGRGAATAVEPKSIELVGPKDEIDPNGGRTARAGCGDNKLDW
jgi:nitrite reductase (NAD(P)H)